MASNHSIVIIGGSFAGLTVASNLLRDIIPSLSKDKTYKVTVVNPSEEFFWKIGAPRTIINPDSLPLTKTLLPIRPHFEKYGEQFELIVAKAESIDHATKSVRLSTGSSVNYNTLVISSGTGFNNHLWSTTPGTDALRSALSEIHAKLPTAETILIAGGGPAGVETAGELGDRFGAGKKDITLLSGTDNLLNRLSNKNVGKDAQQRLEKFGIKVIHGVQVTGNKTEGGKEVLQLSDGSTRTVDIYIPAVGDKPNSGFVPREWLTDKNQVKTDAATLRLDVPGVEGVYVYGTVASYSDGSIADVMFAKKAVLETLRSDLSGTGMFFPYIYPVHILIRTAPGPRTKNVYKKITSDMQFVPIGATQGVGIAFGWKLPSFVVKMAKSKDFMIGKAPQYIEGTA